MTDRAPIPAELAALRSSIDNLDASLVFILSERFKLTKRVGKLKASNELPPADPDRETFQIDRLRRLAQEADLDPVFAERLLRFVIEEVIRHHKAVASDTTT
ncbi:MAG: chorismate mutase [Pelagibacterium sp. SCN 64-44]|nr:MAG: chorismate mutase [Pelagibacterium sp. SCN 64-44]